MKPVRQEGEAGGDSGDEGEQEEEENANFHIASAGH